MLLYIYIYITNILQAPSILLPYLDNFFCFCGNGMIESMLEPHLKGKANATQGDVGITFFILGAVYMVSCPIGGWVSFYILLLIIWSNSALINTSKS